MPAVAVNGTELYYEVRGAGPPLLCIMGASGDGGHFERFAQLLADEFTLVTYDRRGTGRSPPPPGWVTTSPAEQADDAAALLEALGLAPAAVLRHQQRRDLRAVPAGPASRRRPWRDPARAGAGAAL